ncbi:MAG: hypothetical protein ABFD97_23225 [Syntrophobacter sp.]
MHDKEEYERKKKAIFDTMGKRGRERILRIGYENWEPFEEPKDPRERIFGSASLKASALVQRFYQSAGQREESVAMHRELFELCRGFLQGESRSKTIFDFCAWYQKNADAGPETGPIPGAEG